MARRSPSKFSNAGRLVVPASDPINEKVRWVLMRRLSEVLGEEEAETLMESLPPVVWHQIATKGDLKALEERLDSRFALLRGEFAELKGEFAMQMARSTRTVVLSFVGVAVAMLGAMLGTVVVLAQTGALAA